MRKSKLLVPALWSIAVVTLLVACGEDAGSALQFDAAAYNVASEYETSETGADAVSKPEATGQEDVTAVPVTAKQAAPVYIGDSAWAGQVSHEVVVQLARSDALSSSRMTDPVVMKWRYVPKLASSSADLAAKPPVASDAAPETATVPLTESSVVSAVTAGAQSSLDTPDAVLQNASFTLVTVETDQGEQVILMPSEDYTKVCPHRLRMASEFGEFGTADF